MAARKLQLEIDRTLKKVSEGVEVFEGIWEKMQASTHQAQKEKLEQDLKTQIKKLQRLRDQIKTWQQSNEVKDKTLLTDNRKLIETQMERFKACEKEMKTKAFSKEGLSAQTKLDPKEQLKLDMANWVSSMVDELGRQVEVTEAELETLAGTKKKSAKAGNTRSAELDQLNDRRKWHVGRLELILRLLENGNLEPEAVSDIKEDIAYFVESNTEEDFEEDEGIYEELHLEEEEEAFGLVNDDLQSSHDSHSIADTSDIVTNSTPSKPAQRARPPVVAEEPAGSGERSPASERKQPIVSNDKPVKARKATMDGAARPSAASLTPPLPVPKPPTQPAATAPQPRTAPVVLPPIRYSAAAAAAVAPSEKEAPAKAAPQPPTPSQPQPARITPAAATVPLPPLTAATPSDDASEVSTRDGTTSSAQASSGPSANQAANQAASSSFSPAPSTRASLPTPPPQASPERTAATLPVSQPIRPPSAASSVPSHAPSQPNLAPHPSAPIQPPSHQTAAQHASGTEPARLPNCLADMVTVFENAKQKSLKRENDAEATSQLEASFSNVPQPQDAERPKYYVPKNPYPTPAFYPQTPLPILEKAEHFAKYDVDTLFYIFYYHVGSYQQLLAAEELKRRAWRFHKQYLTWFQRANEPHSITEEYEQGVYLYFDWETAWSTRRKNMFTFSYRYLEDGE